MCWPEGPAVPNKQTILYMKRFYAFVAKEFMHVLRDRKTLLILFVLPVVQILIFGFALSNEVKDTPMLVLDQAGDVHSRAIAEKFAANAYFKLQGGVRRLQEVEDAFRSGRARMALVFPADFGAQLERGQGQVQLLLDASDPNTATTVASYAEAVVQDYQRALNAPRQVPFQVRAEVRMCYNPQLRSEPNFVPGVMALVLMLVCVMMTAVSIVREKETGTMEVLLVAPFNPLLVLLSKAVPYLLLSLLNIGSILLLSVFVLGLPIAGSLPLLLAESILFIITCLSLGLLISVKTQTQQSAMLVSLMGMLLPTILLSGFMFPIENMPLPLQLISNVVPARWYYLIVKAVMVKGLGFSYILKPTLMLLLITAVVLTVALKNFKIRLS